MQPDLNVSKGVKESSFHQKFNFGWKEDYNDSLKVPSLVRSQNSLHFHDGNSLKGIQWLREGGGE